MLTTAKFHQNLNDICPHPEGGFLLGVSGGVDSMVLLHLFRELGLRFQVAHVNYKLRAEDSDLDQKTVQEYCRENLIKFHLYAVSASENQPQGSVQLWARKLRYDFFRKIQKDEHLEFLVTAHHLNDQLETFLINLSRGSGIRGLSGIPAAGNKIIRPLLPFPKEEIYTFAAANSIGFREDLSNRNSDYLRNMIRNEITPKLLETNSQFMDNFSKSLKYLHQVKDFIHDKIIEVEKKLLSHNEGVINIDKQRLLEEEAFVQREMLRKYGFGEEEMGKILKAENGKIFNASNFQLVVDKKYLIIRENAGIGNILPQSEFLLTITPEHKILLPKEFVSVKGSAKSRLWKFDADKITLPLKIRQKKDEDIFFPIGMIGKKKIAKFLKDEKLPILARQEIWLLCDGKDDIMGVLPLRQDQRFAANDDTRQIVTLEF